MTTIIYLAVSKQELRKAVKEFNSPSPQPEDPGRALDPGLEEDPDISVEFVDGIFYQASSGGSLVAIIADYPGLLPVSHVSNVGVPTFRNNSFVLVYLMLTCRTFIETLVGTPCGTRGVLSARGA